MLPNERLCLDITFFCLPVLFILYKLWASQADVRRNTREGSNCFWWSSNFVVLSFQNICWCDFSRIDLWKTEELQRFLKTVFQNCYCFRKYISILTYYFTGMVWVPKDPCALATWRAQGELETGLSSVLPRKPQSAPESPKKAGNTTPSTACKREST